MIKYIFKNTVFLIIGRLIFKAFLAGQTIILARFLGVEQFGQFSTALAFSAVFLVFNDLGMNTYMIREGSRDKSKLPLLFGNALIIEFVMSIILYIAVVAASYILKYPPQIIGLISLVAIASLIFEARKIFQGAFETNLKFKIVGIQQIIYSSLLFFLTVAVLFIRPGLKNIAYAQIFVSALVLLIFIIAIFRLLKPKFNLKQIYLMLSGAFAFCLSQLFFIIYFQTDTVILSIFKTDYDVGLYSSVYKLIVAIFIFAQIVIRTCMPVIYKIALSDREKLKRIYKTMLKYLATFGLACSVGMFFLADKIMLFIYGKKYEAAIIIMQFLAWFIVLRFVNSTLSTYLLSTQKQNRRAALQGVAAFLNLGLNLIFIPKWGFLAAASTTLLSEFFLAVAYFIITTRDFREKMTFLLRAIFAGILPIIILSAFLFFTKDYFHVIVEVIFGAVIFGLSLLIFRFFGEYDKKLIRQIIKRDTDNKFEARNSKSETNSNF